MSSYEQRILGSATESDESAVEIVVSGSPEVEEPVGSETIPDSLNASESTAAAAASAPADAVERAAVGTAKDPDENAAFFEDYDRRQKERRAEEDKWWDAFNARQASSPAPAPPASGSQASGTSADRDMRYWRDRAHAAERDRDWFRSRYIVASQTLRQAEMRLQALDASAAAAGPRMPDVPFHLPGREAEFEDAETPGQKAAARKLVEGDRLKRAGELVGPRREGWVSRARQQEADEEGGSTGGIPRVRAPLTLVAVTSIPRDLFEAPDDGFGAITIDPLLLSEAVGDTRINILARVAEVAGRYDGHGVMHIVVLNNSPDSPEFYRDAPRRLAEFKDSRVLASPDDPRATVVAVVSTDKITATRFSDDGRCQNISQGASGASELFLFGGPNWWRVPLNRFGGAVYWTRYTDAWCPDRNYPMGTKWAVAQGAQGVRIVEVKPCQLHDTLPYYGYKIEHWTAPRQVDIMTRIIVSIGVYRGMCWTYYVVIESAVGNKLWWHMVETEDQLKNLLWPGPQS
jgi:hypothetical protein